MSDSAGQVRLFVYGTLRSGGGAAGLLRGCRRQGVGSVAGSLYDIDGAYPALVLEEGGRVEGEIWLCPAERLQVLDDYEGVASGLFRRVRVRVGKDDCWTYVAGPHLARRLTADRRIESGFWMNE